MKYTAITALFALAATTAIASPVEIEARTGSTCSDNTKQVCCDGIACLVQVLDITCASGAYCCETTAGTGSVVNIQALNCVKLL